MLDVIVVGGGLAGTTLAWHLKRSGYAVMLVGDGAPGASQAAAGLITPVTGKALRAEPDYARLLASACEHYRAVEASVNSQFLEAQDVRRQLSSAKERNAWAQQGALGIPYTDTTDVNDQITLRCAYRLDVRRYLATSRSAFEAQGSFITEHVDDDDLAPSKQYVDLPRLGLRARHVVFCRGAAERDSTLFAGLTWRCAKGEVLRVTAAQPMPAYRLHGNGIWLSPLDERSYLLGATYSWDVLDNKTTAEAKDILLKKATQLVPASLRVVEQFAGVRPIVAGRRPVAGAARQHDRLHVLNGLGSKGALLAPFVARCVAGQLFGDTPIPRRYAWRTRGAA